MTKILVVEDNPDVAMATGSQLASTGYEVRVTMNEESALEEADEFLPDAVVLDISMPAMGAFMLARELRARRGQSVRLIAWTSLGRALFDRHYLVPLEFDDVLSKPLALMELRKVLRED